MRKLISVIIIFLVAFAVAATLTACSFVLDDGDTSNLYIMSYQDENDEIQSESILLGDSYSITVPQKNGYIFKGMFDKEEGGMQYIDDAGKCVNVWCDKSNKTLFIRWEPLTVLIQFDTCGAEERVVDMQILYGSEIPKLESELTKEGCLFIGWYNADGSVQFSDKSGQVLTGKLNDVNYPIEKSRNIVTMYAHYEREMISVTCITIKESTGRKIVSVPYGEKIDQYAPDTGVFAPLNTKSGYKGIGYWSLEPSSDQKFDEVITEKITLYAQWIPAVLFQSDGKNVLNAQIATQGTEILLKNIEKPGYSFLGWYDAEGKKVQTVVMPAEGMVLNAQWEVIDYKITYETNGGNAICDTVYTIDSQSFNLPVPLKEHFIFDGWCRKADLLDETLAVMPMGSSGDITLYAKWQAKIYYINYDLNGGSINDPNYYTILSKTIHIGEPNKNGYTFSGWEGTGLSGTPKTISIESGSYGNLYFVATWSANVYTVFFDANGGTVSNASMKVTYDSRYEFPDAVHYGCRFLGWYTQIKDGKRMVNGNIWNIISNTTLYARWSECTVHEFNFYIQNCRNDNGYDPSAPDGSEDIRNRHNGFEVVTLIASGVVKKDIYKYSYSVYNSEPPKLQLKVVNDINSLPISDNSRRKVLSSDTWRDIVTGTNIRYETIGYGAYYVKVNYTNGSSASYHQTNILQDKGEGSLIDIDCGKSTAKISSIEVVVVYEIRSNVPILGVGFAEYSNWHCSYTLVFE